MSKRLKKDELEKLISSLNLDIEDFTLLSSSALVFRGIMEDAGNLDIAVTKEGFDKLSKQFDLKEKGNGFYIVNDRIECIIDDKKDIKEFINGYYVQEIHNYLEYLESSSREKDKLRIPMVLDYINNKEWKNEK